MAFWSDPLGALLINLTSSVLWDSGKALANRARTGDDPEAVALAARLGELLGQDVTVTTINLWLADPDLWTAFESSVEQGVEHAALQLRHHIGPAVSLDGAREAVAIALLGEATLSGEFADRLRHAKIRTEFDALKDGQAAIYELLQQLVAASGSTDERAAATPLESVEYAGPLDAKRGSPFRPGQPLTRKEKLFGRDRLLDDLEFILGDGSNDDGGSINLVGERRMGKTSILNHLVARYPGPVQYRSLQSEIGSGHDLYRRVLEGWDVPSDGASPYDDFEAWLRQWTGAVPLLVLDEFEVTLDTSRFDPFRFHDGLRAIVDARLLRLVVATACPVSELALPVHGTSPLSTTLVPQEIGLIDADAMRACLSQASRYPLTVTQAETAGRWAGGHPCRLQAAGYAWLMANRRGIHDTEMVRREFERLVAQTCATGRRR